MNSRHLVSLISTKIRRSRSLVAQRTRGASTKAASPLPLYFSDNYDIPLPPTHQFPMQKYKMVRLALESEGFGNGHRTKLEPAPLAKREHLITAHDEKYVDDFLTGKLSDDAVRRIGFPWSLDLVYRTLSSSGGTLQAALDAVENGLVAGNLSGGTHHAYRSFGSGYCVFNDIAIAACHLLERGLVKSRPGAILVCDLDVHQGDGTASIFENDHRVVTISFHGKNNFPFRKQKSTVDVEFENGASDSFYLEKLDEHLSRMIREFAPSFLFFQAGVDSLQGDALGKLSMSREGMRARNKFVFRTAKSNSIPVAISLGGGYCKPIDRTVEAHADVFRDMVEVYSQT